MTGTTSTALPSFSHDQHHKTDAAKRKAGDTVNVKDINEWRAGELLLLLSFLFV